MIINAYAVKDIKTITFGYPFFEREHIKAKRLFQRAVNDEQTMLFHYPSDYELYFVGHWDDEKGILNKEQDFVFIANGASLKKEVKDGPREDRINSAEQAVAPVQADL